MVSDSVARKLIGGREGGREGGSAMAQAPHCGLVLHSGTKERSGYHWSCLIL